MSDILKAEIKFVLDAVRDAMRLCETVYERNVVATEKPGREVVTIADYGSQAVICRMLREQFPDDAVIAEEYGEHFMSNVDGAQRAQAVQLVSDITGDTVIEADVVNWLDHGRDVESNRQWLIDPIDGTKGFLGGRHYTIAVGLLVNGKPVAGVLGSPKYPNGDSTGALFYALDNTAFMVGLDEGGDGRQISVSRRNLSSNYTLVESFESAHAAHDTLARVYAESGLADATVKRVDGQDKYAMLATGDADLYVRISPTADYRERVWDHAAGVAVIEAAGGKVTDQFGNALDFTHGRKLEQNQSVVVSNGIAHDTVISAIATVLG